MKKLLAFALITLFLAIEGCAQTQSQSPPTSSTSADSTTSATNQPPEPTTSQDRNARIKESDAVRKSFGY